ncbi:hypothetical protein BVG16_30620 [Paenibacillus selenitireducens]|uniref:Uncharacterized protein n=1 Tax=Paenibacillus selenitireducens TaxID=1324314 RepID=A0A1T2WZH3_9BACL|nr:hypothetical protein BVG16_30620 [Paenibacillus selenitireducens]
MFSPLFIDKRPQRYKKFILYKKLFTQVTGKIIHPLGGCSLFVNRYCAHLLVKNGNVPKFLSNKNDRNLGT